MAANANANADIDISGNTSDVPSMSFVVEEVDGSGNSGVEYTVTAGEVERTDTIPPFDISLQQQNAVVDGSGETQPFIHRSNKYEKPGLEEPKPRGKIAINDPRKWFRQTEYVLFSNEMKNIKKSNLIILKESKEAKRLLDLKYGNLTDRVNRIQTSVIFLSTIAGFFNATRVQFGIADDYISVMSITISAYVSLVLSVSKYYKFDEMKEAIQNLRAKYAELHNRIEHRLDTLGPWNDADLWRFSDPKLKLLEWDKIKATMDKEYDEIILLKKALTTEFEIIMDTKSRNAYHIANREITYTNRKQLMVWAEKESALENKINEMYIKYEDMKKDTRVPKHRHSLESEHEKMGDNWDTTDFYNDYEDYDDTQGDDARDSRV